MNASGATALVVLMAMFMASPCAMPSAMSLPTPRPLNQATPATQAQQSKTDRQPAARPDVPYQFDKWTTDNGLPQNSVSSILQSRDGFLWFTTNDGLVRYDG